MHTPDLRLWSDASLKLVFVLLLIVVNIPNIRGPFPDIGTTPVAISALTAYFLFAAVAFWLDKKRVASRQ